jgi:DNA-binding LytR/AlgR family response regulator
MYEAGNGLYTYKKKRMMGVIEKDIIMYVHCHGHMLNVNMTYTSLEHHGSLKTAMEMLGDDEFVQVNKSDVVNVRYVMRADLNSVTLWNRTKLPITPAYLESFSEKLLAHYSNREQYCMQN